MSRHHLLNKNSLVYYTGQVVRSYVKTWLIKHSPGWKLEKN